MNTLSLTIKKKLAIIKKQLNSFFKLKMKKQVLRSLFKLLKIEATYEKILSSIDNLITGKDIALPVMTGTKPQIKKANDIKATVITDWNRKYGSYKFQNFNETLHHQNLLLLAMIKQKIVDFLLIEKASEIINLNKKDAIINTYLADYGWHKNSF